MHEWGMCVCVCLCMCACLCDSKDSFLLSYFPQPINDLDYQQGFLFSWKISFQAQADMIYPSDVENKEASAPLLLCWHPPISTNTLVPPRWGRPFCSDCSIGGRLWVCEWAACLWLSRVCLCGVCVSTWVRVCVNICAYIYECVCECSVSILVYKV